MFRCRDERAFVDRLFDDRRRPRSDCGGRRFGHARDRHRRRSAFRSRLHRCRHHWCRRRRCLCLRRAHDDNRRRRLNNRHGLLLNGCRCRRRNDRGGLRATPERRHHRQLLGTQRFHRQRFERRARVGIDRHVRVAVVDPLGASTLCRPRPPPPRAVRGARARSPGRPARGDTAPARRPYRTRRCGALCTALK